MLTRCCRSKVNPLDAMVLRVDDMHAATAVNCERPWFVELAGRSTLASPTTERFPFHGKFLHAVIAAFGHV